MDNPRLCRSAVLYSVRCIAGYIMLVREFIWEETQEFQGLHNACRKVEGLLMRAHRAVTEGIGVRDCHCHCGGKTDILN